MNKTIRTANAPAAIGPYSQAVKAGHLVFVSGQLGINPATGLLVGDDFRSQALQAFRNVKALVEATEGTLKDAVKVTVFLASMDDFPSLNEVYAQFFTEPYPARSAVAVKALPKNALVEIEVICAL